VFVKRYELDQAEDGKRTANQLKEKGQKQPTLLGWEQLNDLEQIAPALLRHKRNQLNTQAPESPY